MGEVVWRRGRTQVALLAAVLAVMVAGGALLGVCALLLSDAPRAALVSELAAADARDVRVETWLGVEESAAGGDVVADATATLTGALAPLPADVSTWVSALPWTLPPGEGGQRRVAYLQEPDDVAAHADVLTGRWPRTTSDGVAEVALPAGVADALGLAVGDRRTLTHPSSASDAPPLEVVVVGTFEARPGDAEWARDPLHGAGVAPYHHRITAYGPFVTAPGTIAAAGVPVERASIVLEPRPAGATEQDLLDVAGRVGALRDDLREVLGDRAENVVVRTPYLGALAAAQARRGVTTSGVLVVALLGTALAATTVGLAARLVTGRRAADVALLAARGAGRGRLVAQAAVEAGVLALVATALALPLSLGVYDVARGSLGRELLAPPTVTPTLVAAVLCGTVVLGALLVAPALRPTSRRPHRRPALGVVARSGADVVLLAVAAVAYAQLRAHRIVTGATPDLALVAAPVLCLLAGAVLALRLVPALARRADARAHAARFLTLPLAAWQVSRRPQATAGAFLLVLATACATFGVAFTATASRSQVEQAAASVGTELSATVDPTSPDALGALVAGAVDGTVSPVTSRPVALGSRVRRDTEAPRLVAANLRDADALLRGRLDERTWADVAAPLVPAAPVDGPVLRGGAPTRLVLTGAMEDGTHADATVTLVLEEATGAREPVEVGRAPLDGRPHALEAPIAHEGARVVAVELALAPGELWEDVEWSEEGFTATVLLPGAADAAGGRAWHPATPQVATAARARTAASDVSDEGVRLTVEGDADVAVLGYSDAEVLVTTFDPVPSVPVAVSTSVAEALGLGADDRVEVSLGTVTVLGVVSSVVPYVPSVPRGDALLADVDALSRAALSRGDASPLTDAWWAGGVADPAGATAALADAGVPAVTLAAATDRLRDAPLGVPLRGALAVLVVAAVLLALVGTALHAAAALDARAIEVARLQGLGVARRSVLRSFLAEHGAVTAVVVTAGVGLGALAAWGLGPLLAVSSDGQHAVPEPQPLWPWPTQVAVVAALVVGCAAVVVPLAARTVHRATVAHLRMDAAS